MLIYILESLKIKQNIKFYILNPKMSKFSINKLTHLIERRFLGS